MQLLQTLHGLKLEQLDLLQSLLSCLLLLQNIILLLTLLHVGELSHLSRPLLVIGSLSLGIHILCSWVLRLLRNLGPRLLTLNQVLQVPTLRVGGVHGFLDYFRPPLRQYGILTHFSQLHSPLEELCLIL